MCWRYDALRYDTLHYDSLALHFWGELRHRSEAHRRRSRIVIVRSLVGAHYAQCRRQRYEKSFEFVQKALLLTRILTKSGVGGTFVCHKPSRFATLR